MCYLPCFGPAGVATLVLRLAYFVNTAVMGFFLRIIMSGLRAIRISPSEPIQAQVIECAVMRSSCQPLAELSGRCICPGAYV